MSLTFTGTVAKFLDDTTREISLEGGFRSGKTTAALWKVRDSLKQHPGIQWFVCRYAEVDIDTKLRPAFDGICYEYDSDDLPIWNAKEKAFEFMNGSRCIMYGLQAMAQLSRYSKLRGLGGKVGVAGIMVDEAQEMPPDIALELRGRPSQKGFPIQILFVSNPLNHDDWLARQFPEKNNLPNRRYMSVSIYDNQHNLAEEMIAGLEAAYPPEHAKHKTVILGQRGVNVEGRTVYEHIFRRALHVRPLALRSGVKLIEGFDIWKHNHAWVVAEQPYSGGVWFHGGILGQRVGLNDFLTTVSHYRAEWFDGHPIATCCTAPKADQKILTRYNGITLLREAGFIARNRSNGSEADVVLAMIDRLSGYMRERGSSGEEKLSVHNDDSRWLRIAREGVEHCAFMAEGFEAGYVWDDHFVSVGSQEVKQPKADDWFEHGMRCAETIELNFGASRASEEDREAKAAKARVQTNLEPVRSSPDSWMA